MFKAIYKKGIEKGIRQMKDKMLKCAETKKPIEINGRVFFIQTDIEHLRELMEKC